MAWFKKSGEQPTPEPAPEWAPYFETLERYDRFESVVRAYFKARGIKVVISDGVVTGAGGGGFGEHLGLGNISQLCAMQEDSEWNKLVADHFDRMASSRDEHLQLEAMEADFDKIAPKLAIRLYEPANIEKILDVSVHRDDVPGLVTMLCIDMPDSVHTVTRERAAKWYRNDDELFERAIANTRGIMDAEPEDVEIDAHTKIRIIGGDSYFNASILLFPDLLRPHAAKHGGFVSIPTRSLALAIPFADGSALQSVAALMHFTQQFERDGPGSLSRRVWWHKEGRFIDLPYETTERGIEVHAPEEFSEVMKSVE